MSRILVTGGAGFIGSHIVEELKAAGHAVEVLDNLSSGSPDNLAADIKINELDVRSKEAREYLRAFNPDVIVHAAAQMSVRLSMEDPAFDTEVNVYGLVNLLQAFHDEGTARSNLPYVVFISTGGAIYGEQDYFPAAEDHKIEPASVYGLAKRVSELYLDLWQRQFGLKYSVLRLANIYGPRQNPHGEAGVVAIFYQKLYHNQAPVINGTGEQTRDFVFVKDVSAAVSAAIDKQVTGIYNIGTGVESSVNQLYKIIAETAGVSLPASYGPGKAGEQMRSCIDSSAALKAFSWKPSTSLRDGLRITAEWFRKQVK